MRRVSSPSVAGLLIVASIVAGVLAEASETARYDSDIASSRLTVEGTSTIHDWTVEGHIIRGGLILHELEPSSLWTHGDAAPQALAATVDVEIPVDSLKSDSGGLNRKMYEALKAQTHPVIIYRLAAAEIEADRAADENDSGGGITVNTTGVLTVAGVDRTVEIPMQVKRLPDGRLQVSGETSLHMSEFSIDPPRAMLGTLRTGDTVRVHWTWVLARGRIDTRDER